VFVTLNGGKGRLMENAFSPLSETSILTLFRPVDRDVFVRDLNRQLRTPSHLLPVNSCKKEDKEAP